MSEIKELKRQIEILRMEISTLKERMDDIKPFSQFAKEQEEREAIEEAMIADDE